MYNVKRLPRRLSHRLVFDKSQQDAIHDSPLSLKLETSNHETSYHDLKVELSLGKFESEKIVSKQQQKFWASEFWGLETSKTRETDVTDLFFKLRRKGFSFQPRNGKLDFTVKLSHGDEVLDELQISRKVLKNGSNFFMFDKNGVQGSAVWPKLEFEGQKLPTIIILGGSGGARQYKNDLLSNHGFAVIDIQYHSIPGTPVQKIGASAIDLNYFENALNLIKSFDFVDSTRIGLMGSSFGGEIIMPISRFLNKDKSIKAVCGLTSITWNLLSPYVYDEFGGDSKKVVIPSVLTMDPLENPEIVKFKNDIEFCKQLFGSTSRKIENLDRKLMELYYEVDENCFANERFTRAVAEDADLYKKIDLKINEIEAETMFIYGEDDKNTPGKFAHDLIKNTASEAYLYEGAGHLIDPPYFGWKQEGLTTKGNSYPSYFALGGVQPEHGLAEIGSWGRVIRFFEKHL